MQERSSTTVTGPAGIDSASAACLPPGYRLREFVIERVLGEGGFGVVYAATDTRLERRIAIKEYMPSALATRANDLSVQVRSSSEHRNAFEAGLRSFVNEAKLLARFEHPSLIKVYQFWEEKGTAYMVMPYYAAPTLKAWVKQRGAPPDEAWLKWFLTRLADALEALHREHCLHRDVAPDNILLLPDTSPLLLDFGAARRVIGDMTRVLTVILKPGFAPLEQYAETSKMKQGPWTDVYALCAVAYFVITGRAPAPAVGRIVHDDVPTLAALVADRYSPQLLAALDSGLAVRPEQRPQSMAALRAALASAGANTFDPDRTVAFGADDDATIITPESIPPTVPVRPGSVDDSTILAGRVVGPKSGPLAQPPPPDDDDATQITPVSIPPTRAVRPSRADDSALMSSRAVGPLPSPAHPAGPLDDDATVTPAGRARAATSQGAADDWTVLTTGDLAQRRPAREARPQPAARSVQRVTVPSSAPRTANRRSEQRPPRATNPTPAPAQRAPGAHTKAFLLGVLVTAAISAVAVYLVSRPSSDEAAADTVPPVAATAPAAAPANVQSTGAVAPAIATAPPPLTNTAGATPGQASAPAPAPARAAPAAPAPRATAPAPARPVSTPADPSDAPAADKRKVVTVTATPARPAPAPAAQTTPPTTKSTQTAAAARPSSEPAVSERAGETAAAAPVAPASTPARPAAPSAAPAPSPEPILARTPTDLGLLVKVADAAPATTDPKLPLFEGFLCCSLRYYGDWISDMAALQYEHVKAGAPIKVTGYGRYRVYAEIDGKPMRLGLDYGRRQEALGEFARKHVLAQDPRPRIASFSPAVQNAIAKGRLVIGMTKEQVVMSLGYPARHETASLDAGDWKYWWTSRVPFSVVWDARGRLRDVVGDKAAREAILQTN